MQASDHTNNPRLQKYITKMHKLWLHGNWSWPKVLIEVYKSGYKAGKRKR